MGIAGYSTMVKRGGAPVPIVDEATTSGGVGGSFSWIITNATRRILDRNTPVIVEVGGTIEPQANYSLDYLFGLATPIAARTQAWLASTVTITASYIPTITLLGAISHRVSIGGDLLDATDFDSGGWRERKYGLSDVSVTIERFDDLSRNLATNRLMRDDVLLDIMTGGTNPWNYRGWFVLETDNPSGELNALEQESLSFQLSGDINSSFSVR